MKLLPIEGESHTFLVEGTTLWCSKRGLEPRAGCRYTWRPRPGHRQKRPLWLPVAGGLCPRCSEGTLQPRQHLVETSFFWGNGKCACEGFDFYMRPALERFTMGQALAVRLRCEHILAAREHERALLGVDDARLDEILIAHARSNVRNERQET